MFPAIIETNLTVTSRTGATITGSATPHTKGSWSELIASTGGDAEGIWVSVTGVGASATDTSILLDIGIGAAAAEAVLIPDINAGYANAIADGNGQCRFFPIAVASGSRLSARLQGVVASETATVAIWLARSVQHLDGASAMEAVGEDAANSRGTSVPSGDGAWGAWTSIGTISADRNVFAIAIDGLGDTVFSAGDQDTLVQLGYGSSAPGSGGTAIEAIFRSIFTTAEAINGPFPAIPVYADLASGETLWARVAGADTTARGIVVHAMECPAAVGGGSSGVMTGRGHRVGSAH